MDQGPICGVVSGFFSLMQGLADFLFGFLTVFGGTVPDFTQGWGSLFGCNLPQ